MANLYTQCAFEFDIRSQMERDFIWNLNNRAELMVDGEDSDGSTFEDSVSENGYWGWDLVLSATSAHFSCSESGNIESLVLGLKEFLSKFRSENDEIRIMWAHTCSKMRADEFGGGGVVFTSTWEHWVDVNDALQKASEARNSIKAA